MRTCDERVSELHLRMRLRRHNRARRISAAAYAACAVIAMLFALLISSFPVQSPGTMHGVATASIFADHELLGYVVAAILAFCLGVLVTILCGRIMAHADGENSDG